MNFQSYIGLAILALAAAQLFTGKAYGNMWKVHTREEQPVGYWLIVIGEAVCGVVVMVLARSGFFAQQ